CIGRVLFRDPSPLCQERVGFCSRWGHSSLYTTVYMPVMFSDAISKIAGSLANSLSGSDWWGPPVYKRPRRSIVQYPLRTSYSYHCLNSFAGSYGLSVVVI